jgi:hypothetical protein
MGCDSIDTNMRKALRCARTFGTNGKFWELWQAFGVNGKAARLIFFDLSLNFPLQNAVKPEIKV